MSFQDELNADQRPEERSAEIRLGRGTQELNRALLSAERSFGFSEARLARLSAHHITTPCCARSVNSLDFASDIGSIRSDVSTRTLPQSD